MTDGRTDGQTDGQTDGIAIASAALAMRALRRAVINGKGGHIPHRSVGGVILSLH